MKHSIPAALALALITSFQSARADNPAGTACVLPVRPAAEIAPVIGDGGHESILLAFQRGTAKLTSNSTAQLAELARVLDADPQLRIEVGFIADQREDGERAQELARARTLAVRNALLALGAPSQQLKARPYPGDASVAEADGDLAAGESAQCPSG